MCLEKKIEKYNYPKNKGEDVKIAKTSPPSN